MARAQTSNRQVVAVLLLAGLLSHPVSAYPEDSPWGAADPDAAEHCASCHWEREAVLDSTALEIRGLPERIKALETYTLSIALTDDEARVSGFQLLLSGDDESVGEFVINDEQADLEVASGREGIRSTAPTMLRQDVAEWQVRWIAPADIKHSIRFLLAASAANGDESPFGDQIHYREYEITPLATLK